MLENSLDAWLAVEENALRQEGKMAVSKQRVLINYFIAKATEMAVENDQMEKTVLSGQVLFCIMQNSKQMT